MNNSREENSSALVMGSRFNDIIFKFEKNIYKNIYNQFFILIINFNYEFKGSYKEKC